MFDAYRKKEIRYGYHSRPNVFYVVYDFERRIADFFVHYMRFSRRFYLPDAQQMVCHLKRNVQRGFILVPWALQDFRPGFQSHPLPCPGNHRMKLNKGRWYCRMSLTIPLP
jgi:hypothetical protein